MTNKKYTERADIKNTLLYNSVSIINNSYYIYY